MDKQKLAEHLIELAESMQAAEEPRGHSRKAFGSEEDLIEEVKEASRYFSLAANRMQMALEVAEEIEDMYDGMPAEKYVSGAKRLAHMLSAQMEKMERDVNQLKKLALAISRS